MRVSPYLLSYTCYVEKKRAYRGGRVCPTWAGTDGFSPIFITAALSVVALLAVTVWEMNQTLTAKSAPVAYAPQGTILPALTQVPATASTDQTADASSTPSDPLSTLGNTVIDQLEGAYTQMQAAGIYSTSTAEAVGQSLAPFIAASVAYPTFSAHDVQTDSDTSYTRMLQYRDDLRTAFSPLLQNTVPEYSIYAQYVDTKDSTYLTKLSQIAQNYRLAASSTAQVVAPADAVSYHVAILNAMEEFAATLDAMVAHADDPFASVALLRGYNQAESDMLNSFNSLTVYYKGKHP